MNKKILVVNCRFIKKTKNTNIMFRIYFPVINNIIFKPWKITLLSGTVSDFHIDNKSKIKADDRKEKDELIKLNTEKIGPRTFSIIEPKVFSDKNQMGIISFYSKIMASNQNRFSVGIISSGNKDIDGLNVAQLFQDPKTIHIKKRNKYDFKSWPIISLEEFYSKNAEYMDELLKYYFDNIDTCSRIDPKITSNKNGQARPKNYEIEIKHIKAIENEGMNSTSSIMNAFKKNLDIVYKSENKRKCIICDLHHPNMLVASHIKARSESTDIFEKIDGKNGLWLCAQHDRAFDRRLFTFDPATGKVIISSELNKEKILKPNYMLPKKWLNNSLKYIKFHKQAYELKFPKTNPK